MFDDLEKTEQNFNNAPNIPQSPQVPPIPQPVLPNSGLSDRFNGETNSIKTPIKNNDDMSQRINGLEAKGKKLGKIYSIVGILAIILIFAAASYGIYYYLTDVKKITTESTENIIESESSANRIVSVVIPAEWKNCENDDECVEAQANCCDCKSNGNQSSINQNYLTQWNDKVTSECVNGSCQPSDNCQQGYSSCKTGICTFVVGVKPECIAEGDKGSTTNIAVKTCCEGLNSATSTLAQDGSCQSFADEFICIKCGDSICGKGENKCNCPTDCEINVNTASSTGSGILGADSLGGSSTPISESGVCSGSSCPAESLNTASSTTAPASQDINKDADNDGLTDLDEAKYGTNINNPDTDGDGYKDGDEVKGGYNPNGGGKL